MADTRTDQFGRQLDKVAQQLDTVVARLSEIQVNLSNLAIRYEYIVANMERDQQYVKDSLKSINGEIEHLRGRIRGMEKIYYKFTGALLVGVALGQLAMKYFGI